MYCVSKTSDQSPKVLRLSYFVAFDAWVCAYVAIENCNEIHSLTSFNHNLKSFTRRHYSAELIFYCHLGKTSSPKMSNSSTVPQQGGSFDPVAFSLPFLAQILSGNRGTIQGETFLQQCSSLVSEGILEYVRQMSMGNQSNNGVQRSTSATDFGTLAGFNAQVQSSTKDGKFTVTMLLGAEVKPEDLQVTIKDREIIIVVKIDSKSEDGCSRLYKELTKKIPLPEEVHAEELKTVLSPEGILKIEAPIPQKGSTRSEMIEIPVQMDLA
ncbi:unnamed protein product [Allacma fusca]|uniref:SHSP domain-containing protein n=1 Tax=Allacma fusca TaxID=39272 RepID=A0A8J2JNS0_9HEXA|nr:unnamed protein product [Allacma fusca]